MIKIATFLMFFISLTSYGQVNFSGTFIEGDSKRPIDFLRIIIQDQNDGSLKACYTDSLGFFKINTKESVYNIFGIYSLSDTLYIQKNISLTEDLSLGINEVKIKDNILGIVEISSKQLVFRREVDRLVFNVEHSIASSAGNALEALALTPGVNVSANVITIAGKGNVLVMINDRVLKFSRENLANYLESISSSDIKEIEVITTPPAKYTADGNSGIIRIVLKKSLPNQWKIGLSSSLSQGTFVSGGGSVNFELNKNKFSLYSRFGISTYNKRNSFKNSIFYNNETWIISTPVDISSDYFSGSLGVNYKLTKKFQIGLDIMNSINHLNLKSKSTSSVLNNSNEYKYSIITDNATEKPSMNTPVSVYGILNLDTLGRVLTINLDYFSYKDNKVGQTAGATFDNYENQLLGTTYSTQNKNNRLINNYSGNIDLELPIKFVNLNLGAYLSNIKTSNYFSFFNNESGEIYIDTNQTNEFVYSENRQALYLSGNKTINKKIEIKIGIRAESIQTLGHSKTINETNKNDYINIFPSFYCLYKINKKNSLNLTYSKRVHRPSYEVLNPYRTYHTPLNYVEGNPFLLPAFANNLELNFDTDNNNFQFFYSYINNIYEQLAFVNIEDKSVFYTYYNYLETSSFGFHEAFNYDKIKWWMINLEGLLSYQISSSSLDFTPTDMSGVYSYISIENTFYLMKNLKFYVDYTYNFQSINRLSETSSYGNLYLGLQAKIFKEKLVLGLSMNDVLKTAKPIQTKYTNEVRTETNNYYDNQQVRLSLFYSFGNKLIRASRANAKNKDEKNRLN